MLFPLVCQYSYQEWGRQTNKYLLSGSNIVTNNNNRKIQSPLNQDPTQNPKCYPTNINKQKRVGQKH